MKKFIVIAFALQFSNLAQATPPQLDPSKLMAVHLTDILPKDGLMIPGAGTSFLKQDVSTLVKESKSQTEKDVLEELSSITVDPEISVKTAPKLPGPRFTLHWCLGGPVTPVVYEDGGIVIKYDWAVKRYAILEPLKYILPSSLGGDVNDWISFGPHKLSRDAIIILPESARGGQHLFNNVVYYNPAVQNVSEAVNAFLAERGLPQIEIDFATCAHHHYARDDFLGFLKKVKEIPADATMNQEILMLKDMLRTSTPEDLSRFFLENDKSLIQGYDNEAFISTQLLVIDGAKVKQSDYFRRVFCAYPNLKWQFPNKFNLVGCEKLLLYFEKGLARFLLAQEESFLSEKRKEHPELVKKIIRPDRGGIAEEKLRKGIEMLEKVLVEVEKEIPEEAAKVGKLWLKKIKIWKAYFLEYQLECIRDGKPFFERDDAEIMKRINQIANTVEKNITKPMMALFADRAGNG